MKRLVGLALLFGLSFGTAYATTAPPTKAAVGRNCPYCRGNQCGRGSIGAESCRITTTGCTESGECVGT